MMKKRSKTNNRLRGGWAVLFVCLTAAVFLLMFLPMWNVLVVATSTALDASQSGVKLWWNSFSLEGFEYVFQVTKMGIPFLNSLFVTTAGTVIQVILASLAGYVLIQKDLPFRGLLSSFIMITMMIPGDLTLISVYQLNKQLSLLNSYEGLILNGLISGFSILMMRNYFETVPYSLAESARMDGAGEIKIFHKIILPLMSPGIATMSIGTFIGNWNNYLTPLILLNSPDKFTLPVMVASLNSSTDITANQGAIYLAVAISVIPILIVFAFCSKYIISSISAGGVKE